MRLQEYAENRSITNVIPLDSSHACADFLLDMSPEQAEAAELYGPGCHAVWKGQRGLRICLHTDIAEAGGSPAPDHKAAHGHSICLRLHASPHNSRHTVTSLTSALVGRWQNWRGRCGGCSHIVRNMHPDASAVVAQYCSTML